MADEIFDVVDENDRVIARAPRREVHARGLLHRAVHVLVYDRDGRVLLQKRSASKDRFPNTWSASASGHVDSGEDYDACVVREMREEIGIVTEPPPRRVERITACAETEQEFVWVYVARSDGPVTFEPKEVSEVGWFAPAEVDAWIRRAPADFSPSFRLVWSRVRNVRP